MIMKRHLHVFLVALLWVIALPVSADEASVTIGGVTYCDFWGDTDKFCTAKLVDPTLASVTVQSSVTYNGIEYHPNYVLVDYNQAAQFTQLTTVNIPTSVTTALLEMLPALEAIHMDGRNAVACAAHLKVHIAVEVLHTLNVQHGHPAVALGDEAG